MFVSNFINGKMGHTNYDFVDISLLKDIKLFIDPCLIRVSNTPFSQKAIKVIDDYFDRLFDLYKNNHNYAEKYEHFEHVHEINATKLGYGNGDNGKVKTAEGMISTFKSVDDLFKKGICFSDPIDLPIFIENFAEDCLSDMLTNILFKVLNEYTLTQLSHYGIQPQYAKHEYYYWNIETHSWTLYTDQVKKSMER